MRIRFLLLGLLAASPLSAAEAPFASGTWEHETKTVSADGTGYPLWLVKWYSNSKRKNCSGPATTPERFLTQDDKAVCKLQRLTLQSGKIVFDTFCTNKNFPEGLMVKSTGTYTPDSYNISTISTGTQKGVPVRIVTTGTGKRTAATCTK